MRSNRMRLIKAGQRAMAQQKATEAALREQLATAQARMVAMENHARVKAAQCDRHKARHEEATRKVAHIHAQMGAKDDAIAKLQMQVATMEGAGGRVNAELQKRMQGELSALARAAEVAKAECAAKKKQLLNELNILVKHDANTRAAMEKAAAKCARMQARFEQQGRVQDTQLASCKGLIKACEAKGAHGDDCAELRTKHELLLRQVKQLRHEMVQVLQQAHEHFQGSMPQYDES